MVFFGAFLVTILVILAAREEQSRKEQPVLIPVYARRQYERNGGRRHDN
jgi:hypothetical protein